MLHAYVCRYCGIVWAILSCDVHATCDALVGLSPCTRTLRLLIQHSRVSRWLVQLHLRACCTIRRRAMEALQLIK